MESHGYMTYLNSGLESQEGISRIAHLKDPSEPVLCQISDLQYFQIRGNTPQIQFVDQNIIDDNRGLGVLIERRSEHLLGARIEVRIRSQRGPVEVESHVEMTLERCEGREGEIFRRPWAKGARNWA